MPACCCLTHEHLVRINDPANGLVASLTRAQLWQGLCHTVLSPEALDRSIDAASVSELGDGRLRREIRRGTQTLIDEVDLIQGQSLTIRADTGGSFAGSSLTIQIEEPAPGALFVRFIYTLFGLDEPRTPEEDDARKAAYQASDIERIRQVRRFLAAVH